MKKKMKNLDKLKQGKSKQMLPNLDRMQKKMPGFFEKDNHVEQPNPVAENQTNIYEQELIRLIDEIPKDDKKEDEQDKILMVGDLIVHETGEVIGWDGKKKKMERFYFSGDGVAFTKKRIKMGSLLMCPNCSTTEKPHFVHYKERKHCWKGHPVCSSKGCGEIIGYDDNGWAVWSCQKHKPGLFGIFGGNNGLYPRPPRQLEAHRVEHERETGEDRESRGEGEQTPQTSP